MISPLLADNDYDCDRHKTATRRRGAASLVHPDRQTGPSMGTCSCTDAGRGHGSKPRATGRSNSEPGMSGAPAGNAPCRRRRAEYADSPPCWCARRPAPHDPPADTPPEADRRRGLPADVPRQLFVEQDANRRRSPEAAAGAVEGPTACPSGRPGDLGSGLGSRRRMGTAWRLPARCSSPNGWRRFAPTRRYGGRTPHSRGRPPSRPLAGRGVEWRTGGEGP
jgi:hypothetical protein